VVVINLVYIGLVAEVAVLAGNAAGPANPNLTAATATALTNRNAATAAKNSALIALNTAQANLAAADPPRITAQNNLYSTTQGTITAANAAGVPVTAVPNTANDPLVAEVIAKFTILAQAREGITSAAQLLASAQAAAAMPPTVDEATTIAGRQTQLTNAIAAEAAALALYNTARANLIAANNRAYTVTVPGMPPVTTTLFINNQAAITAQLNTYETRYTTYSASLRDVNNAQASYDAAVSAEMSAQDFYNQLLAAVPPTGAPISQWSGAEDILKAADAKGGIR
jgi:hypothetical protein